MAGFFDQQYIWDEAVAIFDFYMDIHLKKLACKTTTFGWVRPGVFQLQLNSRFLWSAISAVNWYLCLTITTLSFQIIFFHLTTLSRSPFRYDLKLEFHLPKNFFIICFSDSPSKLWKIAFYFDLKALFIVNIFKYLS